jgi:predicted nucleotidyltransferase
VVVLDGQSQSIQVDDDTVRAALEEQWNDGATTRDAVDYVAEALGVARRDVYQLALEARKERPR